MARLASIALLIGAAPAGGDHLWQSFAAARPHLAVEGIGLIGPEAVRDHLHRAMTAEDLSATEATTLVRSALARLCPEARHIVVIAENLPGSLRRAQLLGENGLLYPFAARRLRTALAGFAGSELRIGLAIRHPASFLPACWSAQLRLGPWQSFRAYAEDVPAAPPRWLWLASRILQVCPDLAIWKYEEYPAVLPEIIDWATGLTGLGASLPALPFHDPLLRQRTADLLHAKLAAAPSRNHRVLLRRLREVAAREPDLPPYEPWSAEERARLDAAYESDVFELALASHVRWLTPA